MGLADLFGGDDWVAVQVADFSCVLPDSRGISENELTEELAGSPRCLDHPLLADQRTLNCESDGYDVARHAQRAFDGLAEPIVVLPAYLDADEVLDMNFFHGSQVLGSQRHVVHGALEPVALCRVVRSRQELGKAQDHQFCEVGTLLDG